MAKLKPIITTQEKLNTIEIKKGQFICVKDSNSIYIDTDTERLEYTLPRVLNYLQSGNSISIGGSNTIQGDGCVVLGSSNTASSNTAFILGQGNTVSGECAIAEGSSNTASGACSHVQNAGCTASGAYSTALGTNAKAIGQSSLAFCGTAEGQGSIALFGGSNAQGDYSLAIGGGAKTTSLAKYSVAIGAGAQANSPCSFVFGGSAQSEGSEYYSLTLGNGSTSYSGSKVIGDGSKAYNGAIALGNGISTYNKAVPVIGSGNVLPENVTSAVIIGNHSDSLTEITNNCINVGFLNKIIGRGYAYGEGLQTTNDFETALGAYNLSNSDIIFSIGNGTSADNRSNLLTIYKDGKVETNSFIGASITNWQANYSYKINELVIYNNILYQCNVNHTSLETFEENKWNILLSVKDGTFNFDDLSTAMTTGTQSGISITADTENSRFNFEVTGIPTITIDNEGYWTIDGERGENPTKAQGDKGDDGYSPTVTATTVSNGVDLTIVDKNGTQNVGIRNGADGQSAYEIAVDNGYIGTEEEWLASLKGIDGTTTIQTTKMDKTCTFLATGWSDTVPYTQTVTVEDITESFNPRIDIIISDNVVTGKKEEIAFSYVTKVTTGNGILTAYCYETKPDVDLNIMIEVI